MSNIPLNNFFKKSTLEDIALLFTHETEYMVKLIS